MKAAFSLNMAVGASSTEYGFLGYQYPWGALAGVVNAQGFPASLGFWHAQLQVLSLAACGDPALLPPPPRTRHVTAAGEAAPTITKQGLGPGGGWAPVSTAALRAAKSNNHFKIL